MSGPLSAMEACEDEYNTCLVRKSFYRVILKIMSTGSLSQNSLDFIESDGTMINSSGWHTRERRRREIAISDMLSEASLTINTINPDLIEVDYKTEHNTWFAPLSDLPCCSFNTAYNLSKLFPKEVTRGRATIRFGEEFTTVIAQESRGMSTVKLSIEAGHVIFDKYD